MKPGSTQERCFYELPLEFLRRLQFVEITDTPSIAKNITINIMIIERLKSGFGGGRVDGGRQLSGAYQSTCKTLLESHGRSDMMKLDGMQ